MNAVQPHPTRHPNRQAAGRAAAAITLVALLAAACSAAATPAPAVTPAPAATPAPAVTPVPTPVVPPSPTSVPGGGGVVTIPPRTLADAFAAVVAANPQFAGIRPLDPNMIGASAWYEGNQEGDGWVVAITKGSGDCQAGCIERHTWTFRVGADGSATLLGETGNGAGGGDGSSGSGGTGGAGGVIDPGTGTGTDVPVPAAPGPWLIGRATAGPTCPVEQPGDPACAPRIVVGATVVALDPSGAEIARGTTDALGNYALRVPAGGTYSVVGEPVDGLMGTPEPIAVTVPGGTGGSARADLSYDTGIR